MAKLSEARRVALAVLSERRRRNGRVRDLLRTSDAMAALDARDRSLASRLALGTVSAQGVLDEVLAAYEKDGEILSAKVRLTKTRTGSGMDSRYDIIESRGLAFDHAKIIAFAVLRLRGKVTYTDIALNLVPEYFTLTELQQVYEIILDRELLKAPFRRKYGILAEETDVYSKDAGHRPSKLFRKKWLAE